MAATSVNKNVTTHEQPTSPLFRLPAELRNRIYELALTTERPLGARRAPDYSWTADTIPSLVAQPGLTRTCRAVRSESLAIFYAQNDFLASFEHPGEERAVRRWLEAIGPRNRERLRCLFVERDEYHSYFLEVHAFRRAQSRFLKWLKFEREDVVGGQICYVIGLKCLTIDD